MKFLLLACVAALLQLAVCDPREQEKTSRNDFEEVELNIETVRSKRGYSLDLEHSVDGVFSPRGEVNIDFGSTKPTAVFPSKLALNEQQRSAFQNIVAQNGLYTIRARSEPGNPKSPFVVASVPACFLAKARFREDLAFHVNEVGHLISIEFRTPFVDSATCREVAKVRKHAARRHPHILLCQRNLKEATFYSTGSVFGATEGPEVPRIAMTATKVAAPPGVAPVRLENEPEPEEQQSFFRKYWYIIIPLLLVLMQGGGEPPAQGAAPARR
uniref:ER membrane protein complex subunit 10 n=1 Tax=Achlya hypogyna TaxID=1202772 RepID=A0A0A7CP45_ACHHY|nr:secreted protein [Achlya hypogyna]